MTRPAVKPHSLIRRTMLIVLTAELLCALAFAGTALWHERVARLHAFDEMLQGRSDSLLGAIQDAEDPADNVTIDPTELRLPGSDVYAVYNLGGRLLGASKDAPAELIERRQKGFSTRASGLGAYRVLERNGMRVIDRAETGGVGLRRPVTIVYAAPRARLWRQVLVAAKFYMLISLGLLALTAALLVVLLRRELRPIEELAAQASGLSTSALHFEAPGAALRVSELAPLARTLSTAMDSVRQAFDKERRFVSDAAHELKTSVAVVRSTIQVLTMRPRSAEEYATGLDRLLRDNERVEDLVSRMLTLARMEQQGEREAMQIDLGEAARSTLNKLAPFAEARSVGLTLDADTGARVRLSPEEADVLIGNLVVNAVQHSAARSTVQIQVKRADGAALLSVRDTGAGIAPEALPHIFERFFREDPSRSRDTGGAGLGLAICESIVRAAKGKIWMKSAPGIETVASVSFSLV